MDEKEKFMQRVRIEGEHWIWTGKPSSDGYGQIWDPVRKKVLSAHRRAYELFVGAIPEGMHVLYKHKGLRMCVNPTCLFLKRYYVPADNGGGEIVEKMRFMKNVRIDGDHWLWLGKKRGEYGQFWKLGTHKHVLAHRYSYELFVGPIPPKTQVQHKHEGMKLCVNPACLKLGDHSSNLKDYLGEYRKLPRSKLTIENVKEIRGSVLSSTVLAKMFEVSYLAVHNVRMYRTWKEIE